MEVKTFLLERYAMHDGLKWNQIMRENKELNFIIQNDSHVLIQYETTILESFSLLQNCDNIHCMFSSRTFLFGIKYQNSFSKFRVLFHHEDNAQACLHILKKFIKITSPGGKPDLHNKFTMSDILHGIMTNDDNMLEAPESITNDYPLALAVKLCILDPGFPQFVKKIDTIIKQL